MGTTPLIDAPQLKNRLGEADLRILDCRFDLSDPGAGRRQWREGHVPGAVYVDLDEDLSGPVTAASGRHPLPDADAFCAFLGRIGVGSDSDVVVYDASSGAIAARAWWLLRWMGHERVRLLDGGYAAWLDAGFPAERKVVRHPPAEFTGRPIAAQVLTTTELARRMAHGDAPPVIDARDAARFRGEIEPLDAEAGHIPGALNLPFVDTLTDDRRFRPAPELAGLWRRRLPEMPQDGDWAVMCGSGVTACHLAISAELAGLPPPRLYVGSWSEWIRDPARPRSKPD